MATPPKIPIQNKISFELKWYQDIFQKSTDIAIAKAIKKDVDKVLRDAKSKVKVGTITREGSKRDYQNRKPGSLKKSGRNFVYKGKDEIVGYVNFGGRGFIVDGIDVYYGLIEETMNPFLRPALRKNSNKIKNGFKNLI